MPAGGVGGAGFIEGRNGMSHTSGSVGGVRLGGIVCGLIVTVMLVTGCSSDKPKPMAQPSSEQVKGSADRAFDKLKQEERDHKPAGM